MLSVAVAAPRRTATPQPRWRARPRVDVAVVGERVDFAFELAALDVGECDVEDRLGLAGAAGHRR